jgi:hypothetical protein
MATRRFRRPEEDQLLEGGGGGGGRSSNRGWERAVGPDSGAVVRDHRVLGRLNRPAKEGYEYRSPNQTNANDLTPNLREDVVRSTRADAGRISSGLNSGESASPLIRRTRQEAGARALTRTLGRAAAATAAGEAGYEAGKRLVDDEGEDYKKGGSVSSASKRADGIAQRGKTRGTMIMCGGGMAKRK